MTGLYDPAAAALLLEPHTQLVRFVATHPDLEEPIELPTDVADFTLSFTEDRSPRAALSITTPLTSPDLPALLDPRIGARVTVEAGYVLTDGREDVRLVADLGIRQIVPALPARTLTLHAASDEALAIDAAPTVPRTVTGSTTTAVIEALIRQTVRPAPAIVATPVGAPHTLEVTDRWATITDLADRAGLRVWDDGTRTWHIAPAVTETAATPVLALQTGPAGSVTELSDTVTRDDWANYVVSRYAWRDSNDETDRVVTATSLVTDGPFRVDGPAGPRVLLLERPVPTTQLDANAATAAVLAWQLSRAVATIVQAPAAWWVRAGHTVSINGTAHIVREVAFTGSRMTIRTRQPDLTSTLSTVTPAPANPEDPSPPPLEDPAPPVRVSYVTRWRTNGAQTYKGDGTKRTDQTDRLHQGTFPGSVNGDQQAVALFTGANSSPAPGKRGESGVSIGQALTGATVSRVELTLTCLHAWASTGDARIGWLRGTAIPVTYDDALAHVWSRSWPRGTRRTVNITNPAMIAALLDGSCRGITLGPGDGSTRTYMAFASATHSNADARPELTIHYAK